jgi:hypothetical protein
MARLPLAMRNDNRKYAAIEMVEGAVAATFI